MECIAFGYPVPHYNWTRKNSFIPKSAIVTNYNRVLILPRVDVEDQVGGWVATLNIFGTLKVIM